MIFCELGPGLGRNIEVLAPLYKNATFLLFDIPPQQYVAHQYLSRVFPDRFIKYNESITIEPSSTTIPKSLQGKIVLLPTWKMPKWEKIKIDIFWNSASFQEMEPDVVKNYLRHVISMDPSYIYINAKPGGNYWGEWQPGRGGTKEPVHKKYYFETLSSVYEIKAEYWTDYFLRPQDYRSYIFGKKHF